MNIPKEELASVLSQFNPWWRGEFLDLPLWHRAAFNELFLWAYKPPAPRAVFLSGARQVGKTTMMRQAIQQLLKEGVPGANIFYATFDHPLIKLAGVDATLEAWRERESRVEGPEYIFLDEAQFIRDWEVWVKHQVDFFKHRRVIFTGSAMPLLRVGQESGVGRWHTIQLATLSFYEYIQLRQERSKDIYELLSPKFVKNEIKQNFPSFLIERLAGFDGFYQQEKLSSLPKLESLHDLFSWSEADFHRVAEQAKAYVSHFHEYLARGGFPQTALVNNLNEAQRLVREDIVDKVLKRDMTALFGVRNVLELEQTFLYLCMHNGGLLDLPALCENLGLKRPTVQNFISLLEATYLIYRLQPYGYGKEILRGRYKIYLADPSMAPAVLLKGKQMLDDPNLLGSATETAVFKHLFAHYYSKQVRFSYWQGEKKHEVDIVAELGTEIIPFEVKYRAQHTGQRDLKGLLQLCEKKNLPRAYVVTKSLNDFGPLPGLTDSSAAIMRVPAPLLCYWLGEAEKNSMLLS